jgi:hypothetical protein
MQREKGYITITENSLVAVDVIPLPVPLSFAGNSSGEMAYNTPNIIWNKLKQKKNKKSGHIMLTLL